MKTRSLVSQLLLLLLVPILAEAFSVSRSNNTVTLIGCNNNLYYQGTQLPDHVSGQNYALTVNKTTEGVYECAVFPGAGNTVTVLRKSQAVLCIIYFIIISGQFEINNTPVSRTFTWGQRQRLYCGDYEPGNYHSGYTVRWVFDTQTCSIGSCAGRDHFNISTNDFSLSFDYYPTFTTYKCQIVTNLQDTSIQQKRRTIASYTSCTETEQENSALFMPFSTRNGFRFSINSVLTIKRVKNC